MARLVAVAGRYVLDLRAKHQVYRNAAGERRPGVTTVLGTLAKEALIEWAARVERDRCTNFARGFYPVSDEQADISAFLCAVQVADAMESGPFAYTAIRDTAADLGTVIHARIHASLNNMELDPAGIPPDLYEKSIHGWQRFMEEWKRQGMSMVASEVAMVSEADQVGGTADLVARDRMDSLHLWDVKSTRDNPKWPYDEHIAQVAQYASMWNEREGDGIAGVHLVRVGKEEDDGVEFYTLSLEERRAGVRLFRAALEAYNAKKELRR